MLRFLTAGESHGPALVVTVEGLPAGLPLLLAAERFALSFDRGPDEGGGLFWIAAPAVRDPLVQALTA